jgi:peptide/nickel transport system substrate-binding protein
MKKSPLPYALLLFFILTSCLGFTPATVTPTVIASPPPTRTPEPAPQTTLTICLGAEPNTLYPFSELNSAAQSVLAAIYDGPVDTVSYDYQPVLFTQMPTLENGEAQIVRTEVQAGGRIVEANGEVASLEAGMRVRPAGCSDDECAVTFDGTSALEMDQMVVTFRLRPDLTWSDGAPLTAEDSFYSFQLDQEANPDDFLIERTQSYEVADSQTLQWWGIPGYIDATYFMNYWTPAPRHVWSEFSADELPEVDLASRTPTGWGPYRLREWFPGDRIVLEKNPYYFRAADGYPRADMLIFRIVPDPNTALSEMIAGRCDILDPSLPLDQHLDILQGMQAAGQAQFFVTTGMSIEWLGLGLVPASYDNGYNMQTDRQNYFSDPRTRKGIAYCLDRQSIVDDVLFGLTAVPAAFVPGEHPAFDPDIEEIPYDPQTGLSLLALAGWQDTDNDPSTPLRAVSVKDVAYNTPLTLNYYAVSTAQRRQAAEILVESLSECGIRLDVRFFTLDELYISSSEGPLFGRNFDLAQYALNVEGFEPPCAWFTSEEIPNQTNSWSGTNVTGFSSDEFDAACRAAQSALRDDPAYLTNHRRAQIIFADELPAIPLYHRLRIAAAAPEICHFDLDPTANPLWNIEAIGSGAACQN